MKILLFLLCLIFSSSLFASDKDSSQDSNKEKLKIALLISLNSKEGKAFFNGKDFDINSKIAKEFKKRFDDKDFDIVVIPHTNLSLLSRTLRDESFRAVFFVGHAGEDTKLGAAGNISRPALIADENLYDLKNAFQTVHPNIRYLALISCDSKAIIDGFFKNQMYVNNPNLKIKSFDQKIEIFDGIKEAINAGIKVLAKDESYDDLYPRGGPCEMRGEASVDLKTCSDYWVKNRKLKAREEVLEAAVEQTAPIPNLRLARHIPHDVDAQTILPTQVMVNGRVIGFFDTISPGNVQSIDVYIAPKDLIKGITLSNDSGTNSIRTKKSTNLGLVFIEQSDLSCELNPEKNRKGELLGVGENIYRLKCKE